jgi:hypothetical protein
MGTAQPSWRRAGVCITPAGTLCRTLVYEHIGWKNRSWGFHAIDRYTDRMVEAVRSDGSALLRISHRSFKFYLIPEENYDRARVILPSMGRTVEVERSQKEVHDLGGVWSFDEGWRDEADCNGPATIAGDMRRRTGEQPIVAGIRGIEYLYESTDHQVVQRIIFAPSLGCTAIVFTLSRRNAAGLPISEERLKLVSASLGEPDQSLFAIPSDYRIVKSIPYRWMDTFPGHITVTSFSRPVE